MLKQSLSWLVAALTLIATAQGADLSKVDRSIGREPEYLGQARYALLVFGPTAATRVWLVLDRDAVYVDRNANGHLTDAGEKFCIAGDRSVLVPTLTQPDGIQHTNLVVRVLDSNEFSLNLRYGGNLIQHVGLWMAKKPTFAPDRNSAAVIHFGGPLTFAHAGDPPIATTDASGSRQAHLRLLLGTPGLGEGTFASVRCVTRGGEPPAGTSHHLSLEGARYVLSHQRPPQPVLEYLDRETGETVQSDAFAPLESRCGLVFNYGPLPIPRDAAEGVIQVHIAYPESPGQTISPATLPILVR